MCIDVYLLQGEDFDRGSEEWSISDGGRQTLGNILHGNVTKSPFLKSSELQVDLVLGSVLMNPPVPSAAGSQHLLVLLHPAAQSLFIQDPT